MTASAVSDLITVVAQAFNLPTFFVNIVAWCSACLLAVCGLRWIFRE